MLHYYANRFFNHTLVSPHLDGDSLQVYYIHEVPADQVYNAAIRGDQREGDTRQNSLGEKEDSYLKFKPHREDNRIPTFPEHRAEYNKHNTDAGDKGDIADEGNITLYIKVYAWDSMQPKKVWNTTFKTVSYELCYYISCTTLLKHTLLTLLVVYSS